MIKVYLLGAGKHATEITEYLNDTEGLSLEGYIINIDASGSTHPSISKPIIYLSDFLDKVPPSANVRIIGAIGDYQRKTITEKLEQIGYEFINILHPHTYISQSLTLGHGNCIAPGSVINAHVKLGNHCIINTNCSISHDCIIENYVTISPGVTVAGNVTISEGAFIGAGVTIIPGVVIGSESYVAAGSCITKDVPAHVMVAGVPAQIKKRLSNHSISTN